METKVLISAIIPVYKIPEHYLNQCVRSILTQSFHKFEIILVDDNNNDDDCGTFCDRLAKDHKEVISLHQKNQGVSVARNNGLQHAGGKWIAFIDADDWLEPNYYERLLAEGENHQADIVMCSSFVNYGSREFKNAFFTYHSKLFIGSEKDEIQLQLICRGVNDYFPPETGAGVPWAKLYRRGFLAENSLMFNPQLVRMQDNVFNLYAIERANCIYYFNECLYHYRKNSDSVTRKANPKVIEYFDRVNQATEKFIESYHHDDPLFYKALYAKILIGFNSYINLYYWPSLRAKQKGYLKIRDEMRTLLEKPGYSKARQHADTRILSSREKFYVSLIKRKMVDFIMFLTLINDTIKRARNGSPEK